MKTSILAILGHAAQVAPQERSNMDHCTTDGHPLRREPLPSPAAGWRSASSAWSFLAAARSGIRQYQADQLGEQFIRELRGA